MTEIQILEQIPKAFLQNVTAEDDHKICFQNKTSLNCDTGINIIMQICAKPVRRFHKNTVNLSIVTG